MAEKIKLDIVSDVVCPWCTVGYKRLQKAISELGIADRIEIEWQPFELNPHMPAEGEDLTEHIANKYGSTLEQQEESRQRMIDAGEELDFTFDYFDGMRMCNTREAHVLLDYARENGKQTELKMRFVTAFFSERKDVSDRKVLAQELKAVGLNVEKGMARLDDDTARYEVTSKEQYWQGLGVSSVPTFIFDNKSALTGAQPVATFKQVLSEMVQEA